MKKELLIIAFVATAVLAFKYMRADDELPVSLQIVDQAGLEGQMTAEEKEFVEFLNKALSKEVETLKEEKPTLPTEAKVIASQEQQAAA